MPHAFPQVLQEPAHACHNFLHKLAFFWLYIRPFCWLYIQCMAERLSRQCTCFIAFIPPALLGACSRCPTQRHLCCPPNLDTPACLLAILRLRLKPGAAPRWVNPDQASTSKTCPESTFPA